MGTASHGRGSYGEATAERHPGVRERLAAWAAWQREHMPDENATEVVRALEARYSGDHAGEAPTVEEVRAAMRRIRANDDAPPAA